MNFTFLIKLLKMSRQLCEFLPKNFSKHIENIKQLKLGERMELTLDFDKFIRGKYNFSIFDNNNISLLKSDSEYTATFPQLKINKLNYHCKSLIEPVIFRDGRGYIMSLPSRMSIYNGLERIIRKSSHGTIITFKENWMSTESDIFDSFAVIKDKSYHNIRIIECVKNTNNDLTKDEYNKLLMIINPYKK